MKRQPAIGDASKTSGSSDNSILSKTAKDSLGGRFLNTFLGVCLFVLLTFAANFLSVFYIPFSIRPDLDLTRAGAAACLLLAILIQIPSTARTVFDLGIYFVFLITYIPLLAVWSLGFGAQSWVLGQSIFWLLLFAVFRHANWRVGLPALQGGELITWTLAITCLSYSFGSLFIVFGIPSDLSVFDIYVQRGAFKDNQIPFIIYTITWSVYVVIPAILYLARGVLRGVLAISVSAMLIYAFLVTGQKTFLLVVPLLLVFTWLSRQSNNCLLATSGLLFVVGVSTVAALVLEDRFVYGVAVNRGLVLPAAISFQYFDFFSYHEGLSLSHSVFSIFTDYPWREEPAKIIGGEYYFVGNNANTGIVSDAFANFGFLGLGYLLIALIILKGVIDGIIESNKRAASIAPIVIPVLMWTNVPFLTSLLTGGLALGLLFGWLNRENRVVSI